jgi:hypothetical protein
MARPYSKKNGSIHGGRGGFGGGHGGRGGGGGGNGADSNFNGGRGRGGDGGGRGRFDHRRGPNHRKDNSNANNNNSSNSTGAGADVMKALLSLLFEKSYRQIFVEESGKLDLSNMRASPDLESVQKRVDFNSVSFCKVLAEVLREKFADRIRVLQLDDNNIRQFKVFLSALADADIHRGITAISAMRNSINDLSFISALRRYDNLNEVLLRENSVTNQKEYMEQLIRQLPRLTFVDGVPVDRALLRLPNPLPSSGPSQPQLDILMYLEQTLFRVMATSTFDAALTLYNPHFSALSVDRGQEPLPQRVPMNSITNTSDLEKTMRTQMQADLSKMRSSVEFRNLATDSAGSMRNVAKGPQDIIKKLRTVCGDGKSMTVEVEFNPNFNVIFMNESYHMRVPVCVLTVHGKMRYRWNPIHTDTRQPTFAPGKAPCISTFFDRTMSLTYDGNTGTWAIANDMLLLRPDRIVVHDDGTPSCPLFFANTPARVEQMRRRLMPGVSPEVMMAIVNGTGSDDDVKQAIQRLLQLPPETLHAVAGNPEAAKQAIGMP